MDEQALVHRVCKFIREIQALERNLKEYPCQKCPMSFEHEQFGTCVQACVLQAQELIEIVKGTPSASEKS